MPDTMTVNNAEYTVIKLLGKGEGGYSYLMTDGAYTGKDGGNMKIPWESRLLYAVLALLVLVVFYGIYFAKVLAQKRAASRPGRSGAERKKTFTRSKC